MFPPPAGLLGTHLDVALISGIFTLICLLLIRESVKSIVINRRARRMMSSLFLVSFTVILLIIIKIITILL